MAGPPRRSVTTGTAHGGGHYDGTHLRDPRRDGVTEWVDVKRGAAVNELTEVFGNLNAGDQVAVRATDELRAGTKVRPTQQAAK